MKTMLQGNVKEVFWGIAVVGVPIGYLGIWLDVAPLMWIGVILASPLFVTVLPFSLFLLLASITLPVWLPFYKLAAKLHGAPFQPGDWVRILRGQYRNQIVRVYDVWSDRDQVRVDLGEKAKQDVTDVFSLLQIRRFKESD